MFTLCQLYCTGAARSPRKLPALRHSHSTKTMCTQTTKSTYWSAAGQADGRSRERNARGAKSWSQVAWLTVVRDTGREAPNAGFVPTVTPMSGLLSPLHLLRANPDASTMYLHLMCILQNTINLVLHRDSLQSAEGKGAVVTTTVCYPSWDQHSVDCGGLTLWPADNTYNTQVKRQRASLIRGGYGQIPGWYVYFGRHGLPKLTAFTLTLPTYCCC